MRTNPQGVIVNYAEIIERQITVVQTVGGSYTEKSNRIAYYLGVWTDLAVMSFTLLYAGVKAFKTSNNLFA